MQRGSRPMHGRPITNDRWRPAGKWPAARRLAGWAFLAWLAVAATPADGAIVYLKGQDQPLAGYLVRQTDQSLELREVLPDGRERLRTIARSDVEDLLISVSPERLERLTPDQPDAYREYAEELAEKWRDPEARQTALRLFLIAAHLAPERLGRSCLLGMIPLARNEPEQRRFRAMAYLLDPAHDPQLLSQPVTVARPPASLDRKLVDALLRALRLLRQGNRRDAATQARRFRLDERMAELTDTITYREFEDACATDCPRCDRGYVDCPKCKGAQQVEQDGRRVICPECRGTGRIRCPHCKGNYRENPLDPALVRRILQLELAWLPTPAPAPARVELDPASLPLGWSRALAEAQTPPVTPLSLETLTDLDPRECRFRNGQWVP